MVVPIKMRLFEERSDVIMLMVIAIAATGNVNEVFAPHRGR